MTALSTRRADSLVDRTCVPLVLHMTKCLSCYEAVVVTTGRTQQVLMKTRRYPKFQKFKLASLSLCSTLYFYYF